MSEFINLKKTEKIIHHFYQSLLNVVQTGSSNSKNNLINDTLIILHAILSDPRAVITCPNLLIQRPFSAIHTIFHTLHSTIGPKFNIIQLMDDLITIASVNEDTMTQENLDAFDDTFNVKKKYTKSQVHLEKELGPHQLRRYKWVSAIIFTSLVDSFEERSSIEILKDLIGPFGRHPSVCFLFGLLCYKSGETRDLERAYELFEHGRQGAVLGPTCQVLQALIYFWGAQFGHFHLFVKQESYPQRVKTFIVDFVLDKLLHALTIASEASGGSAAVQTYLRIDLHSAISFVYFCQKWNSESMDESMYHLKIASDLHVYTSQDHTPSTLLLRAGRALNINVASMDWLQMDTLNLNPGAQYLPEAQIILFTKLWPTFLSAPMSPWDSGAPLIAIQARGIRDEKLRTVKAVLDSWWYNLPVITPTSLPYEICEMCGSDTKKRCTACQKVYYCSLECQRNEWQVLHEVVCLMIR